MVERTVERILQELETAIGGEVSRQALGIPFTQEAEQEARANIRYLQQELLGRGVRPSQIYNAKEEYRAAGLASARRIHDQERFAAKKKKRKPRK